MTNFEFNVSPTGDIVLLNKTNGFFSYPNSPDVDSSKHVRNNAGKLFCNYQESSTF